MTVPDVALSWNSKAAPALEDKNHPSSLIVLPLAGVQITSSVPAGRTELLCHIRNDHQTTEVPTLGLGKTSIFPLLSVSRCQLPLCF